jgi:spore germination cell wall hydrolase CwlJ-like protein
MTPATVTALAQVAGLALQALAEVLRAPPRDDAERQARDEAAVALMLQQQQLGKVLLAELKDGKPRACAGEQAEAATEERHAVAEIPRASAQAHDLVSAQAHEVEPPGLVQTGLDDNAHDARRAMAATIWGEARSEPLAGRVAVGWVVRNRAASPCWWGTDVRTCCLSPGQFSCWWDRQGQAVRLIDETDAAFRAALDVAGQVITGDLADPTAGPGGGADHYHRDDVRPHWAAGRTPTRAIGRHLFYRLGPDGRG